MDHQDDKPCDVFEAMADQLAFLDGQLRDALASRSHALEALDFERRRAAAAMAETRALRAAHSRAVQGARIGRPGLAVVSG